jgi:hypothetical protein
VSEIQKLLIDLEPGSRCVIKGHWVLKTAGGMFKVGGHTVGLPEAIETINERKSQFQW